MSLKNVPAAPCPNPPSLLLRLKLRRWLAAISDCDSRGSGADMSTRMESSVGTGDHIAWESLAECLCRARHRVDQKGMLEAHFVLGENHLRRIVREYMHYYNNSRPHMSLKRNAPVRRSIEPPELGKVISIPQVSGLHHRYTRAA